MGAKQSKRSVDISGKEAEGGEVAAAGAGGEGRVEQLADVDALKPQLNGDAQHIHEPSEKEKQLDSGTPENEKDATTEKEEKEQDNETVKEKEAAPVTNGDAEAKPENGESSPAPEEGKKPKKEKVKKKWSLRSISFSRKDKPKQEKKQKEEEAKTNGEPEKLPEEAAEATPEVAAAEVAEEAKSAEESKDEKTPETPVTEPLTNGSSTPESPKVESPAVDEPLPTPAAEPEKPERQPETKPEELPVNGLSLEESKPEPEAPKTEESKPEEPTTENETVPAPEIPVKKEVCVDMPLETTPPPLPANPPPSSVVSFAATTMAPELTDASLNNTAQIATSAPPTIPDTKTDNLNEIAPISQNDLTNSRTENDEQVIPSKISTETELPPSEIKEIAEEVKVITEEEVKVIGKDEVMEMTSVDELETKPELHSELPATTTDESPIEPDVNVEVNTNIDQSVEQIIEDKLAKGDQTDITKIDDSSNAQTGTILEGKSSPIIDDVIPEPELDIDMLDTNEDLPPPPPLGDDLSLPNDVIEQVIDVDIHEKTNSIQENGDANHISEKSYSLNAEILNGNSDTEQENFKNNTKSTIDNLLETIECNGNTQDVTEQKAKEVILVSDNTVDMSEALPEPSDEAEAPASPPSPASPASLETPGSPESLESFPPPPADLQLSQEPIAVSDKLADLIPEVPVVPELNTETLMETSSDVAVAN